MEDITETKEDNTETKEHDSESDSENEPKFKRSPKKRVKRSYKLKKSK